MIAFILVLLLGILILIFCGRLLIQSRRQRRAPIVTVNDYSQARAAVDSVFEETAALRRIFAEEDKEYISRTGTRDVQRFFLNERRGLAIQWVRMTRKQVARLMDLHLRLAGYTFEPSPRFEFRLTASFWWFVVSSEALLILFWLCGPFEAFPIVSYTAGMAENFSSAFSIRLEKTDPLKLGAGDASRFI